ncbi:6-phosphogluconolactonase isoform X1 [Symphalangus syndactylus]|uniref:6-phosphogluconolactonase isoform X1 n=1 Tax=Symphalangus syndactylus TaxID=9590 RepID=UPI00244264E6|nr:6-phosphogluconolactonase isoform X1 [Symphalangus syndactylus]
MGWLDRCRLWPGNPSNTTELKDSCWNAGPRWNHHDPDSPRRGPPSCPAPQEQQGSLLPLNLLCPERRGHPGLRILASSIPEVTHQPKCHQLKDLAQMHQPPHASVSPSVNECYDSTVITSLEDPGGLLVTLSLCWLQTHLLSRLPIPESQVITINPELPVEEAAEDYAKKLRQAFQGDSIPVFDLLILGVGPDGHTCSLFPDHPLLQEREKIVAPISDSPKPPPQRVTLTLPVLNAARTVIFVATGEGKAAVLKRILEDQEENPLPAALVQPHTGKLCWFLDEAAARLLTVPFEKHSTL